MTAVLLFLLSTASAHAQLYVEPELTYSNGKYTETFSHAGAPSVVSASKGGGIEYGVAAGIDSLPLIAGVEYETGRLGSFAKPTDLGVLVGFTVAKKLRIWFEYILSAKSLNSAGGTGYKVGVGNTVLKYLRVDAEMVSRSYGKYVGPTQSPGTTYRATLNTYQLKFGIPLWLTK